MCIGVFFLCKNMNNSGIEQKRAINNDVANISNIGSEKDENTPNDKSFQQNGAYQLSYSFRYCGGVLHKFTVAENYSKDRYEPS